MINIWGDAVITKIITTVLYSVISVIVRILVDKGPV